VIVMIGSALSVPVIKGYVLEGHTITVALGFIAAWSIALWAFRTRDLKILGLGDQEYRRVINATVAVFGWGAIALLLVNERSTRWLFLIALPVGLVGLLVNRWVWRRWLYTQRRFGHFLTRVVVVGQRHEVDRVVGQMNRSTGAVYSVVGSVVDVEDQSPQAGDLPSAVGLDRAVTFASQLGADCIVVAGHPGTDTNFVRDLAWELEGKSLQLVLATSLANVAGPRVQLRPVDGLPLLHVEIPQFQGGKHLLKRSLDVAVAGSALVLLAPLFVTLIAFVRFGSKGPAFFSQERVGRNGELFRMHKFRSMVTNAEELKAGLVADNEGNGVLFKMRNDPRVTGVGRILRKYSLDELPQIWNVLMGDMSLVGPRPPIPAEVLGYEDHVRRRLYIKPGLTGMWQINGRSDLSWEDSVRLDLHYVENWSVVGDVMIMWRTLRVLVAPVGAY
jgi:exopolysaccharide biosynthesis polyprenyl glycosylphosphotransferase